MPMWQIETYHRMLVHGFHGLFFVHELHELKKIIYKIRGNPRHLRHQRSIWPTSYTNYIGNMELGTRNLDLKCA